MPRAGWEGFSGRQDRETRQRQVGAAGKDNLGASHADREHVIELLKVAFAHGRLTMAELDARVGQAFTTRTCAQLAMITADIPPR